MIDSTPVFTEKPNHSVQDWRKRYKAVGLPTIPIVGKSPVEPVSWKSTPSDDQWSRVGPDFTGNIGVLMGNGYAVIDADDHKTASIIEGRLKTLGCTPPTVLSPHGKHFYLRVSDAPNGFNWSKLLRGVYSGELRVRNSYVVAPCSQVNGMCYRWERGTPEDLKSQAVVQWRDLLCLLPEQPAVALIEELPVRLLYRDMPRKAKDLLTALKGATKGQAIQSYRSRSDAEAAVIAMLTLAGWSYEQTLATFLEWSPGKYHEAKGKDKQRYFDRTYFRVLSKIASHPTRQQIAEAWMAGHSNPFWPGGRGYLERDTYLGLLAICWQFGSWEVAASERDLAQYATASQVGIHRALESLVNRKIIEKQNARRSIEEANRWIVTPLGNVSSQVMIYDNFSRGEIPDLAELWSPTKLGRTAGTVYRLLGNVPCTVGQLQRGTGKAWSTVKAALTRLGEFELALKLPSGWVRGAGYLPHVAKKFETAKAALSRRSYHKRQRDSFADMLAKRQKGETSRWK